jgi:radical SAM superfamily enzyme YgiQ (UPF0313 family)
MRFLFVMPRFATNFGDYYTLPLGIAYVTAAMKQAGFEVETLNLNHSPRPIEELLKEAIAQGADVVCTGGLSGHYRAVKHILDAARSARPGILTVLGGGLLSSEPEVVMAGTGADFGVIGEGEETMCELAAALESGGSPLAVPGLVLRRDGHLERSPARKEVGDLDALPWPDYEGFGLTTYLDLIFPPGARRMMSVATSRSCPYRCTFCYHPTGHKYRQRSLDAFFAELDHLVRTYRLEHVNIQDELFSRDPERTREFCRRIRGYGITWDCQLRVDLVSAPLLEELKAAGCRYLSLGIESMDDTILKSMRKHITREQIERALELTRDADVEIQGNLIFGDLEETLDTAHNTLDWWKAHPEYKLSIFFIMVYPGTHLYQDACRRGLIPDRLKFLEDGCPLLNVSRMTEAEFSDLGETLAAYRDACPYPPAGLEVLDIDRRACCTVEMACRKCGRSSRHTNQWVFGTNLVTCPHCRQRHDVEPAASLQGDWEPLFQELLAGPDRLAIWGAGNIANVLLKSIPVLRRSPVFLVDSNISKQGTLLQGRPVRPPSALAEESTDTVLIASVLHQDSIANAVRSAYPGVTRLLTLGFRDNGKGGQELCFTPWTGAAGNFQPA